MRERLLAAQSAGGERAAPAPAEKEVKLKSDFKQENSLIRTCFLNSLSGVLTLVILNSERIVNASS